MQALRDWFREFLDYPEYEQHPTARLLVPYCEDTQITKRFYYDLTANDVYFLLFFIRNSPTCLENMIKLRVDGEITEENPKPLHCSSAKSATILIPVAIKLREGAHAAAVIVDNRRREIEYFDPNGSEYSEAWLETQQFLQARFAQQYPNHEFISTEQFCPLGPQAQANTSLCAAWTLLYLQTRLQFPTLSRQLIINSMLSFSRATLNQIIAGYMCYLFKFGRESGIFHAVNLQARLTDIYEKFIALPYELQSTHGDEFDALMRQVQSAVDQGDFGQIPKLAGQHEALLSSIEKLVGPPP